MRPPAITTAAVLLAILSLTNLPLPWDKIFPGDDAPPDIVIAISAVLGVAGLIAAFGLWRLKRWSYWSSIGISLLNVGLNALGATQVQGDVLRMVLIVSTIIPVLIVILVMRPSSRLVLNA